MYTQQSAARALSDMLQRYLRGNAVRDAKRIERVAALDDFAIGIAKLPLGRSLLDFGSQELRVECRLHPASLSQPRRGSTAWCRGRGQELAEVLRIFCSRSFVNTRKRESRVDDDSSRVPLPFEVAFA